MHSLLLHTRTAYAEAHTIEYATISESQTPSKSLRKVAAASLILRVSSTTRVILR